ncbi:hypothetical protein [Pseudaminobacter salicylatoxidans]|uniref:hypothetical protein n=1 Tax=Pseudaminobacter salicylatoxidans TaxID=93369 RepID=UPI0002ECB9B6|nr:hypothetical protein [Pseudaminobacter salicylatoxidans]
MRTSIAPLLTDSDHWIFAGEHIDALVAYSRREADGIAKDLNSDLTDYSVVRFNAVDGTCKDVTDEFIAEEVEEEPEYPEFDRACSRGDRLHQMAREVF